MTPTVSIIGIDDQEQWTATEQLDAMPSQCWRFAAALVESGYQPYLAVVETENSRLLLPYIERHWHGHTDIATLPGLSGASIVPGSSVPLARWHDFAASRGWVAGYIQLSAATFPNVPIDVNPVHQAYMFLIDPGAWDLRSSTSLIIRRKVAAAARSGATICDDREALAASLEPLYSETLARLGSKRLLSSATLQRWSRDLSNIILGVSLRGTIEGVHLIHTHGAEAELHIVGLSQAGRRLSAMLYAATLERLKSLGVRRCNLGGGGNPGDGLYKFKAWLGATPVPLQSVQQIYDPDRYASLSATAAGHEPHAFFPAYRSDLARLTKR